MNINLKLPDELQKRIEEAAKQENQEAKEIIAELEHKYKKLEKRYYDRQ